MRSMNIYEAATKGALAKVKALLKIDPALVFAKSNEGATPLHLAAGGGHKDVVAFLLANKAEVDATDCNGNTPLHWAMIACHKDVSDLLLDNKANINIQNKMGRTPLLMDGFLRRITVEDTPLFGAPFESKCSEKVRAQIGLLNAPSLLVRQRAAQELGASACREAVEALLVYACSRSRFEISKDLLAAVFTSLHQLSGKFPDLRKRIHTAQNEICTAMNKFETKSQIFRPVVKGYGMMSKVRR